MKRKNRPSALPKETGKISKERIKETRAARAENFLKTLRSVLEKSLSRDRQ
ncbi:MAG: hypothetical protein AAB672_02050 [Patescibacteria group bacterium]